MEPNERKKQILELLSQQPDSGIADMLRQLPGNPPVSTVNRDLKSLVDNHLLIRGGQGRSTVYSIAPAYRLVYRNIGDSYFDRDVDERRGKKRIDPEIFTHLEKVAIFTDDELAHLNGLQQTF